MRTDIILDLGLYFIKNTTGIKTKQRLNDFMIFSEILTLQKYYHTLTDSDYSIKNNKLIDMTLDHLLKDTIPLEDVFFETEDSYDSFSIATLRTLNKAITLFDNHFELVNNTILYSKPSDKNDICTDGFYYNVLKQIDLSEDLINQVINEIKYHQYIYKTFAL